MQSLNEKSKLKFQEIADKKAANRRRPERLFVSLNAREKVAIEAAANEAQLNMTEWARGVLLAEAKREVARAKREGSAPRRGSNAPDPIAQSNLDIPGAMGSPLI